MRYQIRKLPLGEPAETEVYSDRWGALRELLKIADELAADEWLWSVQCETSQGPWPTCTVGDLDGTVWVLVEVDR